MKTTVALSAKKKRKSPSHALARLGHYATVKVSPHPRAKLRQDSQAQTGPFEALL
jgi:hypothetical protein